MGEKSTLALSTQLYCGRKESKTNKQMSKLEFVLGGHSKGNTGQSLADPGKFLDQPFLAVPPCVEFESLHGKPGF